MLLQDLHDSHLCNKLLVAESEEDIWKSEPHCRQRLNTADGENKLQVVVQCFILTLAFLTKGFRACKTFEVFCHVAL